MTIKERKENMTTGIAWAGKWSLSNKPQMRKLCGGYLVIILSMVVFPIHAFCATGGSGRVR